MRIEKAQVSLPTDSQVKVMRSFNAPRALVYRAHTEPKLLQRWSLGPPGWTMPVCEMDVRKGGKYRWRWRSDEDGKEFGFHGVYEEVQPEVRLRHTEFFDPGDVGGDMGEGAMIALDLVEEDGITTITCLMDFGTKQARDAAVSTGMTDGMELSYEQLDRLITQL
jgi:uncharacterized protein YndB with AHSA1/START domain